MPRDITITFEDGSSHVYQNAPDTVTPEQITQRATQDFGKTVRSIDGGKKELGLGEALVAGAKRAPSEAMEAVTSIPAMAFNLAKVPGWALGQVGRTIGETAAYGTEKLTQSAATTADLPNPLLENVKSVLSAGGQMVDPYTSIPKFKQSIATRPLGTAMDISTLLTGGSAGLEKLGMERAGQALGTAGKAIDPINQALNLTGAVTGAIPGVEAGYRNVRDVTKGLFDPTLFAGQKLKEAAGTGDITKALEATRGMPTTPGFVPSLAERTVAAGEVMPSVARLQREAGTVTPETAEIAYGAEQKNITQLRKQLDDVDKQIGIRVSQNKSTADLESIRRNLTESIASQQAGAEARAGVQRSGIEQQQQALAEKFPPSAGAPIGEKLSERAGELERGFRKEVVSPAYNAAFESGETDLENIIAQRREQGLPVQGDRVIDITPLVNEIRATAGEIGSALEPKTMSSVARRLEAHGPGEATQRLRGLERMESVGGGPFLVNMREYHDIRTALNREYGRNINSVDKAARDGAINANRTRQALDDAFREAGFSDETIGAYDQARSTFREQYVPRFETGAQWKLRQEGRRNEALIPHERVVPEFFKSEEGVRQYTQMVGADPQAHAAMREGIRKMFRDAVYDPTTGTLNPNAAARFLSDNQSKLTMLDKAGVNVTKDLQQAQQQALALHNDIQAIEPAAVEDVVGGKTAGQVVDNLLTNPDYYRANIGKLSALARKELANEAQNRIANLLQTGKPEEALADLSKNGARYNRLMADAGTDMSKMKDLQRQAEIQRELQPLMEEMPTANMESKANQALEKMTSADLADVKRVAEEWGRMKETKKMAAAAGGTAPDIMASEGTGRRIGATAASDVAVWTDKASHFLQRHFNKAGAKELAVIMYQEPDRAIEAIQRAEATRAARPLTATREKAAVLTPLSRLPFIAPQGRKRDGQAAKRLDRDNR